MAANFLILGCGYTGERVARRLAAAGRRVVATSRDAGRQAALRALGVRVESLDVAEQGFREKLRSLAPKGGGVLLSIPTLRTDLGLRDPTSEIVQALEDLPARVVYLSTTGVYGEQQKVNERTQPSPQTERQRLRAQAEQAVLNGPWPSLILRAAAIYGPGRGVQVALPSGKYRLVGDGANFVSRIHVEDLAEIASRALESDLIGAFPVADDCPSTSREIAEFCANLLGIELNPPAQEREVDETRRADRRVDGSRIRELLGVTLRYPSYREGIPASLEI